MSSSSTATSLSEWSALFYVVPAPGVVGTDNFAAKDIEYPAAVLHEWDLPAADRERIVNGNAKGVLHLAQHASSQERSRRYAERPWKADTIAY